MTQTAGAELRLARPRWRVALGPLGVVCWAAAVVGYGLALGASERSLAILIGLLLVIFAWPVILSTASVAAQLTGAPPALTPDGIRLRVRPWRRRLVTIPWSEVKLTWIAASETMARLHVW